MTHFEFKCSGRSVKHLCASWKKYIDRHTIHTSTFPQLQVKAKGLSSEAMSNKARIRHTLLRFGLRMMDIDLAVACFPESPSYRDKTHGAGNWLIWFEMNVYCTHTHSEFYLVLARLTRSVGNIFAAICSSIAFESYKAVKRFLAAAPFLRSGRVQHLLGDTQGHLRGEKALVISIGDTWVDLTVKGEI
jgi:hypothetical protein